MANDANFNFYLNRQGARGQKGEKGDQGFSPSITTNTNTADEYTLLIQNEYDSFVTDNVRPTYDDRGGTYVRVDRANNVQYFGEADVATTAQFGTTKLATEDDVATGSTTDNDSNVVTAGILKGVKVDILADTVTLTTAQTITGFKTFDKGLYANNIIQARGELSYYSQTYNKKVFEAVNDSVTINGSLAVDGDVTFYGNINTAAGVRANFQSITAKSVKVNNKDVATADTVDTMQSDLNIAKQDIIEAQGDIDNLQMNKQNKLTAGSGITIDADNVISATGGGGGTGDVSAAGDNTFTGENTFNGVVNLNGVSTAENLTVKRNLTSNGEINAVSIKTTGLRSDDIQTTANKKYLTEVDVDNQTIQVVDGKLHANLDELGNEVNSLTGEVNTLSGEVAGLSGDVTTLSGRVTAVENAGYITASEAPVSGVRAPLKLSADTASVPEMTQPTTDGFSVTVSRFSAEYSSQYYKCFNTDGSGWYAGGKENGSDYIQIVFPRPLHLRGASIKQNGNINSLVASYTLLITQNGTDWTEVLSDNLPQTIDYQTSKIINSNCLGFRFRANSNYAQNGAAISGITLDLTELPTTATLAYDDNFELDSSNQLSLNSVKFSKLSRPILDVPVNNCVLAMPTAPTFDGTNVKVYAGTKVAIPNGLNADGTCKSNIVTLTADATINQSTFNGDITLMLKSNGTIDQTAYSYFEVDDISAITTLTPYCWYYDRKTNNHYLASSTGAKQGAYQRIKIGSYNQAEAATTKYFKTYKPIALEKLDITGSCIPDYSAGITFTKNADHVAPRDGVVLIFANLYGVAGGSSYMTINGVRLNIDMGGNSGGTYYLYFPVAKGDTYKWTDPDTNANNNYNFYPLKGAK